jgi:hypothetical protein
MAGSSQKDFFISYSTQDSDISHKICRMIEDSGIKCWIAPRDVRPGKEYDLEILDGINKSNSVVVIISKNSNKSQYVKRELERAVAYNKPIYPIRIEKIKPSRMLEFFISTCQWTDLFQSSIEIGIRQLMDSFKNKKEKNKSVGASRQKNTEVAFKKVNEEIAGLRYVKSVFRNQIAKEEIIYAYTFKHVYKIEAIKKNIFLVSGGWFDDHGPSPRKLNILGCFSPKTNESFQEYIAATGLCICFENNVVTSEIKKIMIKSK